MRFGAERAVVWFRIGTIEPEVLASRDREAFFCGSLGNFGGERQLPTRKGWIRCSKADSQKTQGHRSFFGCLPRAGHP